MPKDDLTLLNVAYALFGLLVALVCWYAIETVGIQTGWQERYDEWYPLVNNLGAVLLGALTTWWLRRDEGRRSYHLAAISELRRVSWPSAIDTRRMTVVVCIVVGIFAVILAAFDLFWAKVFSLLIG